jgi:hypothetical protein
MCERFLLRSEEKYQKKTFDDRVAVENEIILQVVLKKPTLHLNSTANDVLKEPAITKTV